MLSTSTLWHLLFNCVESAGKTLDCTSRRYLRQCTGCNSDCRADMYYPVSAGKTQPNIFRNLRLECIAGNSIDRCSIGFSLHYSHIQLHTLSKINYLSRECMLECTGHRYWLNLFDWQDRIQGSKSSTLWPPRAVLLIFEGNYIFSTPGYISHTWIHILHWLECTHWGIECKFKSLRIMSIHSGRQHSYHWSIPHTLAGIESKFED